MDKQDKIIDLMADLDATLGDNRKIMAEIQAKADTFDRISESLDADFRRLNELRNELADDLGISENPDSVWVIKRSNIRSLDRLAEMRETLDKLELSWTHLNLFKTTFELASQNLNYSLRELRKGVGKIWGQVEKEID